MTPIQTVISAFEAAGCRPKRKGDKWTAHAPTRTDKRPSLEIKEGDNGGVLVHDFGGDPKEEILAAVGLTMADLMPTDASRNGRSRHAAVLQTRTFATAEAAIADYERTVLKGPTTHRAVYEDGHGNPLGWVIRRGRGSDKIVRPVALIDGRWIQCHMPRPRPLYRLPSLADVELVFITEGETAADALRELGFVATTWAGGSNAVHFADWVPLGTATKTVVLLADNDSAGGRCVKNVFAELSKLPQMPTFKLVTLPDLPDKGDAVQYAEARRTAGLDDDTIRAEVLRLVDEAEAIVLPPASRPSGLDDTLDGASDSFLAPIDPLRARNESEGQKPRLPVPVPISQLNFNRLPIDWQWGAYLAGGHTTLFTGLWKCGKTTLLSYLLRDFGPGGDLGGEVKPGKVLVISEESTALWARRQDDLHIGDHVHVMARPFKTRLPSHDWISFVGYLAGLVESNGYNVVVFDTIGGLWGSSMRTTRQKWRRR